MLSDPVQSPSLLDLIGTSSGEQLIGHPTELKVRPIGGCGDIVFFYRCTSCGHRVQKISGCDKRTCMRCAKVRRNELVKKYLPWIQTFKYPLFITLTMVRQEFLGEGVDKIIKSFQVLRQRKFWKARTGLWTLEIVEKEGGWHIHIHCLADAYWVDQRVLSRAWKEITRDSFIVDVRRARRDRFTLLYLIKYVTKFWELSPKGKEAIEVSLKGRRFISYFGEVPEWPGFDEEDREYHHDRCEKCGGVMELVDRVDFTKDGLNPVVMDWGEDELQGLLRFAK